MNRVQLIGRLGRDPESGRSGKGSYTTFSLATNEYWTDRDSGELVEHTEWHQLICYDRLAEIDQEFLTKGSEVYVEGRQRTTRWTDKDGKEQRGSEIRIDEMRMLRRAPKVDPLVAAVKGMASIETLMKDVAGGLRNDVTLADLAGMLNVVRTTLMGDDKDKEGARESTTWGIAAWVTARGGHEVYSGRRQPARRVRPESANRENLE